MVLRKIRQIVEGGLGKILAGVVTIGMGIGIAGADMKIKTIPRVSNVQVGQEFCVDVVADSTASDVSGEQIFSSEWDVYVPVGLNVVSGDLPTQNDFYEGWSPGQMIHNEIASTLTGDRELFGNNRATDFEGPQNAQGILATYCFTADTHGVYTFSTNEVGFIGNPDYFTTWSYLPWSQENVSITVNPVQPQTKTLEFDVAYDGVIEDNINHEVTSALSVIVHNDVVSTPQYRLNTTFNTGYPSSAHVIIDDLDANIDWKSVSVEDPFHSLKRRVPLQGTGPYTIDCPIVLVTGDINKYEQNIGQRGRLNILDFGSIITRFNYSNDINTPWGWNADPRGNGIHAGVSRGPFVGNGDLSSIFVNFLEADDNFANCEGMRDGEAGDNTYSGKSRYITNSISVAELYRIGQGELAVADLNNDGILDERDMSAFARGNYAGGEDNSNRKAYVSHQGKSEKPRLILEGN